MRRSVNPRKFLSLEESGQVSAAVERAEQATSAELKVVVLGHCWIDIRDKAAQIFRKHGLHKTAQRNCVMILLVAANREFLVYGDEGIHTHVRQAFWNQVRDEIARHLADGHFGDGLCAGIHLIGSKLSQHFPVDSDNRNEISDEAIVED